MIPAAGAFFVLESKIERPAEADPVLFGLFMHLGLSRQARMLDVGVAERHVYLRLAKLRDHDFFPNIVLPKPLESDEAVLRTL